MLASVGLQVFLVEVPALRSVFQLGVPDVTQWAVALALGGLPALAEGLLTRLEGSRAADGHDPAPQDLRPAAPPPATHSSARASESD